MTRPVASTATPVLRSVYSPSRHSVSLELAVTDEVLPGGSRLALTSVVQLTPPTPARSQLVRQLATYHEFSIGDHALDSGCSWRIDDLEPSHRPRHSNEGPLSAFVIAPDDTVFPVFVEPMRIVDSERAEPTQQQAGGASISVTSSEPALVPFPVSVAIADPMLTKYRTAFLDEGSAFASLAWAAVSKLELRLTTDPCLQPGSGMRVLAIDDRGIDTEAYRLAVDAESVTVTASSVAGFRHAFVTLARWLPTGLPTSAIVEDHPKYSWRGLHIDLARRWFEPDFVERLIDVAAWRKLSRLHLHLTDDEAWRLPIDGYPELTDFGATRGHGLPLPPMLGDQATGSGRAYTPGEIARWVNRSEELGVTLVPEVDLPAHAHAAITALPWLRDPDDRSTAMSVQYFTNNVLIPGHPRLDDFLDAVIDSVATLFPSSPWIHIGGDEVPEGAWHGSPIVTQYRQENGLSTTRDVECAFHRNLAEKVHARAGRQLGAWQEAAESGGLDPSDGYVVGWRTPAASRSLAAAGFDVVVSPGQAYYLDMATDRTWSSPGASWAGSVSLEDVCRFVPGQGWSETESSRLLGVQACLWAEFIENDEILEHLLFPRLDAVAERAWTDKIVGGASSLRHRAGF